MAGCLGVYELNRCTRLLVRTQNLSPSSSKGTVPSSLNCPLLEIILARRGGVGGGVRRIPPFICLTTHSCPCSGAWGGTPPPHPRAAHSHTPHPQEKRCSLRSLILETGSKNPHPRLPFLGTGPPLKYYLNQYQQAIPSAGTLAYTWSRKEVFAMPQDIIVIRIPCQRCGSDQLHVFNPTGTFSCLGCRVLGYATMRFLLSTCSVIATPQPLPK